MNRNFPYYFSVHLLRVSSQFGWIHATAIHANGIRQLREANLFGWFYAIGGWEMGATKRVFTQ